MSCCNKIANLGCVSVCNTIELPFIAEQTGTYIAEINFLNISYSIAIEAEEGNNLELSLSSFNETSCITFRIKDPNCNYLTHENGGILYDCFQIKTNTQIFINNTSPGDFSCNDFNNDFL